MRAAQGFRVLFVSSVVAAIAGCGNPRADSPDDAQREVRVAAASDLKFALDEIVVEFHKSHADIHVEPTYGSSGNFFAQLSQKAPFDVFLSADREYPQKLIRAELAAGGSEFPYAVGRLVAWVRNDSKLDLGREGWKALEAEDVKKISLANPRHAPYGRAAERVLRDLGLLDRLKDKLVFADNVAQAAQFVESGAADIGLIARPLAESPRMKASGRSWPPPPDVSPKLEQYGVILSWAKDRTAAETFCEFLRSDRGKAMLLAHGFETP